MIFEDKKEYELFARVDFANESDTYVNLTVTLLDDSIANIKINNEAYQLITLGKLYYMEVSCKNNGTRNQLFIKKFQDAFNMELDE